MRCETIVVATKQTTEAKIDTYFLDNYEEIDSGRKRPLVIICPGGGYRLTSDREAEAVAVQYLAHGYHACVLRYSVAPARFPQALCELAWGVDYFRRHAEDYGIHKEQIFITGFSAGGHLAASLGVFWKESWLSRESGLMPPAIRPDGLILCYPVITSGAFAHRGSFEMLIGELKDPVLEKQLSLENQVSQAVPPVFIWHTWEDPSVPVENTLCFVTALRQAGVSAEVHIFPRGVHGLALANEETKRKGEGRDVQKRCQDWISLAAAWIEDLSQEDK